MGNRGIGNIPVRVDNREGRFKGRGSKDSRDRVSRGRDKVKTSIKIRIKDRVKGRDKVKVNRTEDSEPTEVGREDSSRDKGKTRRKDRRKSKTDGSKQTPFGSIFTNYDNQTTTCSLPLPFYAINNEASLHLRLFSTYHSHILAMFPWLR